MNKSILPLLIVFDVDFTLLPLNTDAIVDWPCTRISDGKLADSHGAIIDCYPEVPEILETLTNKGIKLAIVIEHEKPENVTQLLNLFQWNNYFTFVEIYPGNISNHFRNIHAKSGIPFDKMIFFYSVTNHMDVDEAEKNLKIFCVNVLQFGGMTKIALEYALEVFKAQQIYGNPTNNDE